MVTIRLFDLVLNPFEKEVLDEEIKDVQVDDNVSPVLTRNGKTYLFRSTCYEYDGKVDDYITCLNYDECQALSL